MTMTFEHEAAAVGRLAGFGDEIEILTPRSVRVRLVATAQAIITTYGSLEQ